MIYFITDGDAIKIGRSKDVEARMRDLLCGSARPFSLIGTVEGGPAHELKVHSDLSDFRVRGEWFADCPSVRGAIANYMQSGIQVNIENNPGVGPDSEIVRRCRIAADLLITRVMQSGRSKMEAYEIVAKDIGTSWDWLRKFASGHPAAREPRISVGYALLESAGLLVVGTTEADRGAA